MTDTAHAVTEMATTIVAEEAAARDLAPRTVIAAMTVITEIVAIATTAVAGDMRTGGTPNVTRLLSLPKMSVIAELSSCSSSLLVCALAS